MRSIREGPSTRVSLRYVLDRLFGQAGIQMRQRVTKTPLQDRVAIVRVGAFRGRFARGDFGPMQHRVAERAEPAEGGLFDM